MGDEATAAGLGATPAQAAPPSAASARAAIAIDHLSLRYGAGPKAVVALDDIGFDVREGEFVSVVGPSGCGKSTLLKILAGLLPPTQGTASLNGSVITGPRRDIGVVFQSPVLFPWRTVLGNVLLPADVQGLDKAAMQKRALDLVKLGRPDGL